MIVDLNSAQARYLRLQFNENTYFHLDEVEIYGVPSVGVGPTTPAATPTTEKVVFRNNSYSVVLTKMAWKQAKSHAESPGGHLVTISDEPENTFVVDLARQKGVERDFWIGLTDEAKEGAFVWVTGEPLNYTKWHPGEPNNYGGNENHAS